MAKKGGSSIHENRRKKMYAEYKRKLLGSHMVFNPYLNKDVEAFNYNQHAQKELFDLIYEVGGANGFNRYCTGVITRAKSGMPKSNYIWAHRGTIGWKLWELKNICKAFGIQVKFIKPKHIGDARYTATIEGVNGEFLVLSSLNYPKFHITFAKDDLYDFHVDFSTDQHIRCLDNSRKQWNNYFRFVKDICEWYFIRKRGKKSLPFNLKKFEAIFILKFDANETHHKHLTANSNHKAIWEDNEADDNEVVPDYPDDEFLDENQNIEDYE